MAAISKAVILARGLGKRMRQSHPGAELDSTQASIADTGTKAMIPIGRPFLDYVLSGLADAGLNDVCLVIGPEHALIRDYYERTQPQRIRVNFALQEQALGTADALLAVEPFAGGDEFIVLNSDNYYPADVLWSLRELDTPGAVMFDREALVANSNIPAERVRQFAYATVDPDGFLVDLVEKPEQPTEEHARDFLVSMNCWRFSREIFPYCRCVPQSARGEFELPEAVRLAARSGMRLRILRSRSGVLDLSVRGDIAAVAERLRGIAVNL